MDQTERIVFDVPVDFTAAEFAALCRISPDSPAFELVEECIDDIREHARPKAVVRWADVNRVEGSLVTVNGVVFDSLVVADKLKDLRRVFLSVSPQDTGSRKAGSSTEIPFSIRSTAVCSPTPPAGRSARCGSGTASTAAPCSIPVPCPTGRSGTISRCSI